MTKYTDDYIESLIADCDEVYNTSTKSYEKIDFDESYYESYDILMR